MQNDRETFIFQTADCHWIISRAIYVIWVNVDLKFKQVFIFGHFQWKKMTKFWHDIVTLTTGRLNRSLLRSEKNNTGFLIVNHEDRWCTLTLNYNWIVPSDEPSTLGCTFIFEHPISPVSWPQGSLLSFLHECTRPAAPKRSLLARHTLQLL